MRRYLAGSVLLLSLIACASKDESTLPEEPGDGIDGDGTGEEDAVPGAAEEPEVADEAPVLTELDELRDDTLVPPEMPAAEDIAQPTAAAPKILYLNFGGPVIRSCSTYCNDSATNKSSLVGAKLGRSSVDFLPYTSAAGKSAIVAAVKSYFSRYHVTVTTRRPASTVKYTMAVISPSNVGSSSTRGTSYLDCANGTKSDIVFVYRIGGTSASRIARYVAHEIGHSLGLMHVTYTGDLMQYASSGARWTVARLDVARNPSGYTCWPGRTTQDEPAALRSVLGLRP